MPQGIPRAHYPATKFTLIVWEAPFLHQLGYCEEKVGHNSSVKNVNTSLKDKDAFSSITPVPLSYI